MIGFSNIKLNFPRFALVLTGLAGMIAFCALGAGTAWAGAVACLPGLPCTTAPTAAQLLAPTTGPNASKSESAACDANFMNQIYAKAFMEAEREVVVNNSLIAKPDSVLEYTCYDQTAARIATTAGPIFSESTRWSPTTISVGAMGVYPAIPLPPVTINVNMGNTYLDGSIERLALQSLLTYVNSNFSHTFLGGASALDTSFSSTVAGVSGVCDFMYNIYHVSKCDDFGLNAPFIGFDASFTALNLLGTDPRTLPVTCPGGHRITAGLISTARNQAWNFAAFDPVDVLLPIMQPPGGACANPNPIPTGMMVSFVEYGQDLAGNPIVVTAPYQYEDKVCSNPGCYFEHNNNANPGDDRCIPIP